MVMGYVFRCRKCNYYYFSYSFEFGKNMIFQHILESHEQNPYLVDVDVFKIPNYIISQWETYKVSNPKVFWEYMNTKFTKIVKAK